MKKTWFLLALMSMTTACVNQNPREKVEREPMTMPSDFKLQNVTFLEALEKFYEWYDENLPAMSRTLNSTVEHLSRETENKRRSVDLSRLPFSEVFPALAKQYQLKLNHEGGRYIFCDSGAVTQ